MQEFLAIFHACFGSVGNILVLHTWMPVHNLPQNIILVQARALRAVLLRPGTILTLFYVSVHMHSSATLNVRAPCMSSFADAGCTLRHDEAVNEHSALKVPAKPNWRCVSSRPVSVCTLFYWLSTSRVEGLTKQVHSSSMTRVHFRNVLECVYVCTCVREKSSGQWNH